MSYSLTSRALKLFDSLSDSMNYGENSEAPWMQGAEDEFSTQIVVARAKVLEGEAYRPLGAQDQDTLNATELARYQERVAARAQSMVDETHRKWSTTGEIPEGIKDEIAFVGEALGLNDRIVDIENHLREDERVRALYEGGHQVNEVDRDVARSAYKTAKKDLEKVRIHQTRRGVELTMENGEPVREDLRAFYDADSLANNDHDVKRKAELNRNRVAAALNYDANRQQDHLLLIDKAHIGLALSIQTLRGKNDIRTRPISQKAMDDAYHLADELAYKAGHDLVDAFEDNPLRDGEAAGMRREANTVLNHLGLEWQIPMPAQV